MPTHTADVALNKTIRAHTSAIFTYHIPPELQNTIQLGQLVWVPLKTQLVQGIVVKLHSPTADFEEHHTSPTLSATNLRNIASLADTEAIIPPLGLHLAQWVAQTYVTALYNTLTLLLPPGVSQTASTTWQATPTGHLTDLGTLPEHERAILYYLCKHGQTTEKDLQQHMHSSDTKLRNVCTYLQRHNLIQQSTTQSKPRVRPRTEQVVQLLTAPDNVQETLQTLNRSPKQQTVFQWLAETVHSTHPVPNTLDTRVTIEPPSRQEHQDVESHAPIPVNTIYAATGANLATLRSLQKKGILALEQREIHRNPLQNQHIPPDEPLPLTPTQRYVWEIISSALDTRAGKAPSPPPNTVFLLHGVTGSGKTEIYLRAVARTLRHQRQALILVPEIALTTQLIQRFAARFPYQLAILHSNLSDGERYDEWRRIRHGQATVVIGTRSAVFAPLTTPGLIIIDEEHEPSYKHDRSPRYHARDVALHLGALANSVIILGSATPSLESYHAAQTGRYTLLHMPERIGRIDRNDGLIHPYIIPLPHVRLLDMRQELHNDNRSIFSYPLQQALATTLEREEQIILFLNRRGAATFVMCRDCGHVIQCPSCGSPLVMHYQNSNDTATEHASTRQNEPTQPTTTLMCHTCTYRTPVPTFCPQCLSTRIKSFGIGTQRVEQEVQQLFPHARTLRWDHDSTTGKHAHNRLLEQFLHHQADILIGTQMIAKGLDLPRVALVGVIAADTNLHLPDFRSGERTFQLLTQVAGRAGRRTAGAHVIIQTYTPEHYALQAAREHDYHTFYKEEISFRRQMTYPPFGRLIRFIYTHTNQTTCRNAAHTFATNLETVVSNMLQKTTTAYKIIGPAPAFFQRLRNRWRWHILLCIASESHLDPATPSHILAELAPPAGWIIDVDPMHVL